MIVGERLALQRGELVPAFLGAAARRCGSPSEAGWPTMRSCSRERATKLPLRSIRPPSQPSGRCRSSISILNADESMIMASPSGGLPGRSTGTSMVMIGALHETADADVGNLHLAGLAAPALQLDRRWIAQRQRLAGRPREIDELLAVLVGQHDPAAGQAGLRALGLLAELGEIVGLQRRRRRQHRGRPRSACSAAHRPRSPARGWNRAMASRWLARSLSASFQTMPAVSSMNGSATASATSIRRWRMLQPWSGVPELRSQRCRRSRQRG